VNQILSDEISALHAFSQVCPGAFDAVLIFLLTWSVFAENTHTGAVGGREAEVVTSCCVVMQTSTQVSPAVPRHLQLPVIRSRHLQSHLGIGASTIRK